MDLDRLERLLQLVQTGLPMRLYCISPGPKIQVNFFYQWFLLVLYNTIQYNTSIYSQELLFFCFFRIILKKNDAKVSSQGGDKKI